VKWSHVAFGVGAIAAVGGTTVAMWPLWADSIAEKKAVEWLERRFDQVSIESFDLERHTATLRGVDLVDEGLTIHFNEVNVAFDMNLNRDVTISIVDVVGGSIVGTSEALKSQQTASSTGEASASSSQVSAAGARLSVQDVVVSLTDERGTIAATVSATSTEDLVSLVLTSGEVSVRDRTVIFAEASAAFHPKKVFPLEVSIVGAATSVTPEIPVSSVTGTVTVVDKEASRVDFDLRGLGSGGGAAWTLGGEVYRNEGRGRISVSTEGFALGQLPDLYDALPVVDSKEAQVHGTVFVQWDYGIFDAEGTIGVKGLTVSHPMLATTPVRDIGFEADAAIRVIPSERRLEVSRASIQRNAVAINAHGVFSDGDEARYELSVSIPKTPCQNILKALPADLVPGLQEFELGGTFGMQLEVLVVPADAASTVLRGDVGIDGCKIEKVPDAVAVLDDAFMFEVRRKDGVVQSILLDGAVGFTPLEEIAPVMAAAVITTEDGGFWKHDGFLRSQFEASLRRNVELGRIKRGASTLTMQMVKNVLLSHERTLSRKMQELFLTWVVESRLSKKRIMEIYLNVVEFGPGIYGVTHAALHYFNKLPSELNGKEAAFLATMLPSPVRRHVEWCRGALSEKYAAKVDRVFKFMHDRRRIDEVTWETDRDIVLEFDLTGWPGEQACRYEDAALLNAKGVQWSESGLLAGRSGNVSEELTDDEVEELPEELPGEL
jgi:hypothetical protein